MRRGRRTGRRPTPERGTPLAAWCVRHCASKPRGGVLYVFMPPLDAVESYLELVAAVERTAARLSMRVLIEGYPPPSDPRLSHFLDHARPWRHRSEHPSGVSWASLVEQTTTLYEEARQAGLSSETFQLDGRHTGTGGGNHFVLGGATPADSPFLRRPDLLRSLVSYWHNHPSLSYLFSGLFLGPTSQAPRIDEAVTTASTRSSWPSRGFRPPGAEVSPWLVDRALRHLLVDVTGNTHRAEFCIDKLYSPDTRIGPTRAVEMRAFEMPPDARMSLAQQLLLRALVARFWREPYEKPLTRWGTELHDRFMLPFFVWLDFVDVARGTREIRVPGGLRLVRTALRVPLSGGRRTVGARHSADPAAGARTVARAWRGRRGRRYRAIR